MPVAVLNVEAGIANYYAIVLPYMFGMIEKQSFLEQVNELMASYYTHPLVGWSNKKIAEKGWESFYGITLMYYRGFVYLLKVAAQLQAAGSGGCSLDAVVKTLLRKKLAGKVASENDFLDLVRGCLGEEAMEDHDAMATGKLIVPANEALGPAWVLVRNDKERFDLCMDPSSFGAGRVEGLQEGSRAALAGLQNGDEILENVLSWQCEEHFEQMMIMKISRHGQQMTLQYWPRSWEKVEAWEFVRAEDEWTFIDLTRAEASRVGFN